MNYQLTTNSGASLKLAENGAIISLAAAGHEWASASISLWEMVLQGESTRSVLGKMVRLDSEAQTPKIIFTADQLVVSYESLKTATGEVPVQMSIAFTAVADAFEARIQICNQSSEWTVREVEGPRLGSPVATDGGPALLWPSGAGQRFEIAGKVGKQQLAFPTRACMSWMGLDAGNAGFSMAQHDASLRTRMFTADTTRVSDTIMLAISSYPFCAPGQEWSSEPIVLRPYAGSWHSAADFYRQWVDTWWQQVDCPEWAKETSGWQLVILKQQNGEIHWPYTDIDRLGELAQRDGLDTLGFFGWTEGGHDRRYPIYNPDPVMGGEAELKAGIARLHEKGLKVILYTNGQLLDLLTEWYADCGLATSAVSERGEPFGESWVKYKDAPPKPQAYACQSCQTWSDRLVALAKKIQGLGADGLIYDQLGSVHPMFCFSTEHNHDNPAMAIGAGAAANLARVQREMAEIDPEFIVITEHVADGVNMNIDLTHGCGIGFAPGGNGFPEMLRYTIPEILATQRHPSPVMDRNTANWTCLYGFAHEVEYRYWPDRLYVDEGVVPEVRDYERIGSTPNIPLMRSLDPVEASAYLKSVTEFAKRHVDLLRYGRFRDVLGFTTDNSAVVAKAYESATYFGVVLMNTTGEAQAVDISVPGAQLVAVDAPGEAEVNASDPMPPQSLRILRFEK